MIGVGTFYGKGPEPPHPPPLIIGTLEVGEKQFTEERKKKKVCVKNGQLCLQMPVRMAHANRGNVSSFQLVIFLSLWSSLAFSLSLKWF